MQETNRPATAAFLERLQRRSTLSPAEQRSILALPGQGAWYASRRDLVTPGETVHHSILVVSGLLGRFDLMRDGSRQITAIYVPGEMCTCIRW